MSSPVLVSNPAAMGGTIADWIAHHHRTRPGEIALRWPGGDVCWRRLDAAVERVASGLASCGVGRGDRVALLMENRPDWLVLFAACARRGATLVPMNTRASERELEVMIDHADVSLRVVGPSHVNRALALGGDGGEQTVIVEQTGALLDGANRLSESPIGEAMHPEVSADLPALIMYTSGTTGKPKGVRLTWHNLLWNHRQFVDELGLQPDDCNLAVAPFFHVAGLNVVTGPLLYAGGTSLVVGGFDPAVVADHLCDDGVTGTFMVPAMWRQVLDVLERRGARVSDVRFGVVGGAPPRPELFRRAEARGIHLVQGYGMTEAGPMVTMLDTGDPAEHERSVGFAAEHVDVRAVDEVGELLPPGRLGELQVRGPNVCDGYWRDPERTDRAFEDGWFATGDFGHVEASGRVSLVGRRDDMIISGGENVFPRPVEERLERLPDVDRAAVVGLEDRRWGEAVTAVVIPSDGEAPPELDDLRDDRTGLATFKRPRRLAIVDALPRNPTGKLDRPSLVERLQAGDIEISERRSEGSRADD